MVRTALMCSLHHSRSATALSSRFVPTCRMRRFSAACSSEVGSGATRVVESCLDRVSGWYRSLSLTIYVKCLQIFIRYRRDHTSRQFVCWMYLFPAIGLQRRPRVFAAASAHCAWVRRTNRLLQPMATALGRGTLSVLRRAAGWSALKSFYRAP